MPEQWEIEQRAIQRKQADRQVEALEKIAGAVKGIEVTIDIAFVAVCGLVLLAGLVGILT